MLSQKSPGGVQQGAQQRLPPWASPQDARVCPIVKEAVDWHCLHHIAYEEHRRVRQPELVVARHKHEAVIRKRKPARVVRRHGACIGAAHKA